MKVEAGYCVVDNNIQSGVKEAEVYKGNFHVYR
jgi:hypothetical protein